MLCAIIITIIATATSSNNSGIIAINNSIMAWASVWLTQEMDDQQPSKQLTLVCPLMGFQ